MPPFAGPVNGAPCWIDLTVANLEGVKPFYNALFGWEYADMGEEFGHYNIISVGEDVVGGAMQYSPEFMGPTEINTWGVYFASENAEETLKTITDHGGQVTVPAMQVADQGTSAEAMDSTGAMLGIWQPDNRKGFDRWGEHGFPGWFELHTRDFDAASTFYSTVMSAELGTEAMEETVRYHTLDINGEPQAGIFEAGAFLPEGVPNYWLVYLIVDDTDAAVATAQQHGGTVVTQPVDSRYGRFATLQDPSGATFAVISGAEM